MTKLIFAFVLIFWTIYQLQVTASPLLTHFKFSVSPNVYKPSQPFTLKCTLTVEPPNSKYTVSFKQNGKSIGAYAMNGGNQGKWTKRVDYITEGSGTYPTFTATITPDPAHTEGSYQCTFSWSEIGPNEWGAGSTDSFAWNTNSGFGLTSKSAVVMTILFWIFVKYF